MPQQDTQFKSGAEWKGNAKGRPKGKTIKELVREWLEDHPDDMKAFVEHFVKKNKELAWQMLEGRPQQDITSAGEKIIPVPILDVSKNPSNNKDTETDKEGENRSGGDISQQNS